MEGWVDAGRAGTPAAAQLAEGGTTVATFDPDAIYDYRARRPILDILDGKPMSLAWADLRLIASRVGDRDLLVLTGPSPTTVARALVRHRGAGQAPGVVSWVSLGAIPAAVPHTRPVPVLATASARGLLPDGIRQGPEGLLRVPSARVSVLELAAAGGHPGGGLLRPGPALRQHLYPERRRSRCWRSAGSSATSCRSAGWRPGPSSDGTCSTLRPLRRRTRAYVERLEALADESGHPPGTS